MIGNSLLLNADLNEENIDPNLYFNKAARIFENIILEIYEKEGRAAPCSNDSKCKKVLSEVEEKDEPNMKELKTILKEIYLKIEDHKEEEQIRNEYIAEKKRVEEEDKAVLNAFGKPILEGEDKKIKFIGVFGSKKPNIEKENKIPEEQPSKEANRNHLD